MVMISYNWAHQDVALSLYHNLTANGVNTWIDVYNMSSANNLAQAMGETIESAKMVLICFSEAYQKSLNCQHEALYAFDLKKTLVFAKFQEDFTPTGWLGFIQAYHQYYSFYNGADFDENFDKLLQNIKKGEEMFLEEFE